MKESVGILIIAKDTNNFMLLHRATKPIVWSILTGKMDKEGETPLETVKREIREEINLDPSFIDNIKKVGVVKDTKIFHVFLALFLDSNFSSIKNFSIFVSDTSFFCNNSFLTICKVFKFIKHFN